MGRYKREPIGAESTEHSTEHNTDYGPVPSFDQGLPPPVTLWHEMLGRRFKENGKRGIHDRERHADFRCVDGQLGGRGTIQRPLELIEAHLKDIDVLSGEGR